MASQAMVVRTLTGSAKGDRSDLRWEPASAALQGAAEASGWRAESVGTVVDRCAWDGGAGVHAERGSVAVDDQVVLFGSEAGMVDR
ncbi:hypothetical protein BU198_22040 [Streptomyces sp. CBMA156]|nr:hypothetical protein [Streptomyces sp. CBMA156]